MVESKKNSDNSHNQLLTQTSRLDANTSSMTPRSTLLLLCIFVTSLIYGQNFDQPATLSHHLTEVNKHWSTMPEQPTIMVFASDDDRIQAHLFGVYEYLKNNRPKGLNDDQVKRRDHLLSQLKRYAQKRQFPKNTGHLMRTPYFIDQFNTPCAVANLMLKAGDQELAESLRLDYNFNYIAEMPQQPLQAWAYENGFEAWELAWIQPGYSYYPTTRFQQRNTQLSNEVNHVEYLASEELTCYATNGENIYASCFTCLSNDGTFQDYGAMLNGNAMTFVTGVNTDFIVGGAFTRNDSTFGLAMLDFQENPMYWHLSGHSHYTTRAIVKSTNSFFFSTEISSDSTFIYEWSSGQSSPSKVLLVNGVVNSMVMSGNRLIIGGNFDEARIQNDSVLCNNIVSISGSTLSSLDRGFAGYVNKLRVIDTELYAVGRCNSTDATDSSSCAIKWENNAWTRLISDSIAQSFFNENEDGQILDIIDYNDTTVLASNFSLFGGGVMNYYPGKGLWTLDENGNLLAKAFIEGSVNSMTLNNEGLLEIGGDFEAYTYHHPESPSWIHYATEELMYSGKIAYGLVGTEEVSTQSMKVYPNPASQSLNVQFNYNIERINLYDASGKLLQAPVFPSGQTAKVDVNALPTGLYIIEAQSEGKLIRKEFIVE